jgi:uncharacterized protein (DUF2252 family)
MTGVVERKRATHKRAQADQHLSRADRIALGKDRRAETPLESHAEFAPAASRDPVGLLIGQAATRVPELVPIRHGRMSVSPFSFYRGAALPMAADLSVTPASGFRTQICGDAHLSNFGAFASPSRRLVFDVNDFDETLPGPFEWDLKRLAASFSVACRESGFSAKVRHRVGVAVAESYRTTMRDFAHQSLMDVWYAHLDVDRSVGRFMADITPKRRKRMKTILAAARNRDSMQALDKLTTMVDGQREIISDPPTIVPIEAVESDRDSGEIYHVLREVFGAYRRTLSSNRAYLIDQFTLERVARKVVGVGSVGTRAWIVLMSDGEYPLFLQAKEAEVSVLADYCGHSEYANHGERVVAGQLLMQAESDIFLGWTRTNDRVRGQHDYYIRQLRDWKFSLPVEQMRAPGMAAYARLCGWTLARAHARAGDRVGMAAYLGGSARFDHAIADFAESYAEQNERDYAAFREAVRSGRIEAIDGV